MTNFEYENNCNTHLPCKYILIDQVLLSDIQKFLSIHKITLEDENTNGGHSCVIGYDFNKIFKNLKFVQNNNEIIINFLKEEKLLTTKYFLSKLQKAIDLHYAKFGCAYDCICTNCEPEECKCDDCFGFILKLNDTENNY